MNKLDCEIKIRVDKQLKEEFSVLCQLENLALSEKVRELLRSEIIKFVNIKKIDIKIDLKNIFEYKEWMENGQADLFEDKTAK